MNTAATYLLCVFLAVTPACTKEKLEVTPEEELTPESCSSPFVAPILADAYQYPLRPGMAAWGQLQTGQQMVDACQLPAAVLASISTAGLVATCLDYPLLGDIFANWIEYHGMQRHLQRFNGFVALQQRPEAAALLLARYQQMGAGCLPPTNPEQALYSFSFGYVEYLLAHDGFLQQLSGNQRRDLLREALRKYDAKKPHTNDVYGIYGLKTAVFVLARVLHAERYAPFEKALTADPALQVFLAEANLEGQPQLLESIVRYARKFN